MPKSKRKAKLYAVAIGRKPGIYSSWEECQRQINGYSRAKFKSFTTREDAQNFMNEERGGGGFAAHQKNSTSVEVPSLQTKGNAANEAPTNQTGRFLQLTGSGGYNEFGGKGGKTLVISIYYDGGARGNPGPAGAGAHVVVEEFKENRSSISRRIQIQIRKFLGHATNNVAEYTGVISGLEEARKRIVEHVERHGKGTVRVNVKGDSNLVTCQLNGSYACKAPTLIPLYKQAKALLTQIRSIGSVTNSPSTAEVDFQHVYREQNKIADALANEAMDARHSWTSASEEKSDDDDLPTQKTWEV